MGKAGKPGYMTHSAVRTTLSVILLWLVGLGAAGQFAKLAVPFDLLQAAYPDAGARLGWSLTLISAIGAVFGMTAGVFVVNWGLKRVIIAALLIGAAMSFWQATLPALPVFLISRVVEGISHLMIVVAAPTLLAQTCSDRYRGVGMTLWSTFFGVSFAIVAWLGMPFANAHGLGACLAAHGGCMALLALAVAFGVLREAGRRHGAPNFDLAGILRQHKRAYQSPRTSAPAYGWLFYTTTFVALLAVLPGEIDENHRALIVGLMPLVSIAVALVLVGAALSVTSACTLVIIGFLGGAATCASYYLGVPMGFFALTLFAVLGLVQGASFALVPELNEGAGDQALANGAMAQLGNLGNLLGTPVLLAVLGLGTGVLIAALMALYLGGAGVHVWLRRRRAVLG